MATETRSFQPKKGPNKPYSLREVSFLVDLNNLMERYGVFISEDYSTVFDGENTTGIYIDARFMGEGIRIEITEDINRRK